MEKSNAEDRDINQMDTNTQPELLPCPFCGGEAYYTWTRNGDLMAYVGCARCGIAFKAARDGYGDDAKLSKDIVGAWNARSPRDEEAVEKAFTALNYALAYLRGPFRSADEIDFWAHKAQQHAKSLRTLLDHASKSPHPVERGEG